MVASVRRFSRAVTQRVGALDERFLGLDRPLGEARLLWEIGVDGCAVRTLRTRLELDSGYLSRLLRGLEAGGLVVLGRDEHDRRARRAMLTRAGREEWDVLERRGDERAAALLEPRGAAQRERLVSAMDTVQRLLDAATVQIVPLDPTHRDARYCLGEYAAELDRRFPEGFDPELSLVDEARDLRPPRGLLLVASLRAEPVGCGALRFRAGEPSEIKRVWVATSARGLGLGRRLLACLEELAESPVVRLDTNRVLEEAIALYRSAGYLEVPPFNDERYAHHWFEKRLKPSV